jgi:hypothetical protein
MKLTNFASSNETSRKKYVQHPTYSRGEEEERWDALNKNFTLNIISVQAFTFSIGQIEAGR